MPTEKPTRQPERLCVLDGLRALAVLLVLSFHYWQQSWLSPTVTVGGFTADFSIPVIMGALGVPVLFAMSGFGLYYSARPDRPFRLKTYFLKRVARIVPTYWLCVIVCALFQIGRLNPTVLRTQFLANMTFTQMMTPALGNNQINGVLWSLAIEVQFYVLFPLIRRAFLKKPYLTTLCAVIAGQLWRTWRGVYLYDDNLWFMSSQLIGWIDVFVLGMLAAHIVLTLGSALTDAQKRAITPAMSALCCAGILLIYLAMRYCYVIRYANIPENGTRNELTVRVFVAVGACLALTGGAFPAKWLKLLLGNRVARFLGGISYQIYMWHIWIALRLKDLRLPPYTTERPMDDAAWRPKYVLLSLALTLTVSVLITCLAERPLSRLILRLADGKRPRRKKEDPA